MAAQKQLIHVSPGTLRKVKEIKKQSGVAIGRLADLGLNFFCAEVQKGTLVIQNGQIIPVLEKANGE